MWKESEEKQFWAQVRSQFDTPKDTVVFSDAMVANPPRRSIKAAEDELDRFNREERLSKISNFNKQLALVERTREKVADLMGTKPENIIFENTTTKAMKLVAAMVLSENDGMIATQGEHPQSLFVFFNLNYDWPLDKAFLTKKIIDDDKILVEGHWDPFMGSYATNLTFQNYGLRSGGRRYESTHFFRLLIKRDEIIKSSGEITKKEMLTNLMKNGRHVMPFKNLQEAIIRLPIDDWEGFKEGLKSGKWPEFPLTVNVDMDLVDIGKTDEEMVRNIEKKITPRTRLIFVSHVLREDGRIMPVKEICEMAKKHSTKDRKIYVLIDGAQAVGNLHPSQINVEKIGCDFYAAGAHKMLLSTPATGFLYVRDRRLIQRLAKTGAHFNHEGGLDSLKAFQFHPKSQPIITDIDYGRTKIPTTTINELASMDGERLDKFCRISTPEIASFNNSLEFLEEMGWDRVNKRLQELRDYAVKKFTELGYIRFGPEMEQPIDVSKAFIDKKGERIDGMKYARELENFQN